MNEIWKTYVIHDDHNIKGFFGEYRWLSNFHICEVVYDGVQWPSSENAYQAMKVRDEDRKRFETCTPSEAKKFWKKCVTIYKPEEWDLIKRKIMEDIVFDKFHRNLDLREKLIETFNKHLEETNHWNDIYWGVNFKSGIGRNELGNILMNVRRTFVYNELENKL